MEERRSGIVLCFFFISIVLIMYDVFSLVNNNENEMLLMYLIDLKSSGY